MSFNGWFSKTLYATTPRDPDPFFHPRSYQKTKDEVVQAAQEVIRELPRWQMEEYREKQGRICAIRRSWWVGFVSEIDIYIVQGLDGVTRLEMTSQFHLGKGDWGQNRRNIREFLSKLDARLAPLSA